MIEMKYGKVDEPLILWKGIINNFEACIISYGTHPCAYIKVTDDFEKRVFDKWNVNAEDEKDDFLYWVGSLSHGGFTFYGAKYLLGDGTWLGWDYAHIGDYVWNEYVNYFLAYGRGFNSTGNKKWKTEEIYNEIKEVIKLLKEYYYDV